MWLFGSVFFPYSRTTSCKNIGVFFKNFYPLPDTGVLVPTGPISLLLSLFSFSLFLFCFTQVEFWAGTLVFSHAYCLLSPTITCVVLIRQSNWVLCSLQSLDFVLFFSFLLISLIAVFKLFSHIKGKPIW